MNRIYLCLKTWQKYQGLFLMATSPNGGLLWQDDGARFETISPRPGMAPSGKWVTEKWATTRDAPQKWNPKTLGAKKVRARCKAIWQKPGRQMVHACSSANRTHCIAIIFIKEITNRSITMKYILSKILASLSLINEITLFDSLQPKCCAYDTLPAHSLWEFQIHELQP